MATVQIWDVNWELNCIQGQHMRPSHSPIRKSSKQKYLKNQIISCSADDSPPLAALIWQPFTEWMPSTLGLPLSGRGLGLQAGGPRAQGLPCLWNCPAFPTAACLPARLLMLRADTNGCKTRSAPFSASCWHSHLHCSEQRAAWHAYLAVTSVRFQRWFSCQKVSSGFLLSPTSKSLQKSKSRLCSNTTGVHFYGTQVFPQCRQRNLGQCDIQTAITGHLCSW